jgi:hypothetical protein
VTEERGRKRREGERGEREKEEERGGDLGSKNRAWESNPESPDP